MPNKLKIGDLVRLDSDSFNRIGIILKCEKMTIKIVIMFYG